MVRFGTLLDRGLVRDRRSVHPQGDYVLDLFSGINSDGDGVNVQLVARSGVYA